MKKTLAFLGTMIMLVGTTQAETFLADVWADNWFSLSVNGTQVAQDSVSINTERSFNAESFSFTAARPFVLGLIAKDFRENDTGLEYIGTRRQQMGDGGVIMQIKDTRGHLVAVTDSRWDCMVAHRAPVQKSCADERNPVAGQGACQFEVTPEPVGWDQAVFNTSAWPSATVHSEHAVRPKGGYNRIAWDRSAQLIWSSDLETHNTILCRLVVQ